MNGERERENIPTEFKRVAEQAKSKIKKYLLNRVGLASHEVRIDIDSDNLIKVRERSSELSPFDKDFYVRIIDVASIHILNTSGTSPAITQISVLIKPPQNSRIKTWHNIHHAEVVDPIEVQYTFIESKSKDSHCIYEIPLLAAGKVLHIPEGKMYFWAGLPEKLQELDEEFGWNQGTHTLPMTVTNEINEQVSVVSKIHEAGREANDEFTNFLADAEIWLGIVIDSQELLPFRWEKDEQQFVPGFFTDGTVVR